MPYFKTSQEWLDQSALLLEARPATVRHTSCDEELRRREGRRAASSLFIY